MSHPTVPQTGPSKLAPDECVRGYVLTLLQQLHHDHEGQAHSGVTQVKEEIFAVDIVNVAIVGVCPLWRPGIDQHKCIATILKARPALYNFGTLHGEMMFAAELGAETIVGNTAIITAGTILLLASFRSAGLLTSRFLTNWFLAAGLHGVAGLLLFFWSCLLLLWFLSLLCGPGLVLPGRLHFILFGLRLFGFGLSLILPLGLFLFRFVFLLFFVLRVENRRTRDHGRENS